MSADVPAKCEPNGMCDKKQDQYIKRDFRKYLEIEAWLDYFDKAEYQKYKTDKQIYRIDRLENICVVIEDFCFDSSFGGINLFTEFLLKCLNICEVSVCIAPLVRFYPLLDVCKVGKRQITHLLTEFWWKLLQSGYCVVPCVVRIVWKRPYLDETSGKYHINDINTFIYFDEFFIESALFRSGFSGCVVYLLKQFISSKVLRIAEKLGERNIFRILGCTDKTVDIFVISQNQRQIFIHVRTNHHSQDSLIGIDLLPSKLQCGTSVDLCEHLKRECIDRLHTPLGILNNQTRELVRMLFGNGSDYLGGFRIYRRFEVWRNAKEKQYGKYRRCQHLFFVSCFLRFFHQLSETEVFGEERPQKAYAKHQVSKICPRCSRVMVDRKYGSTFISVV